MEKSISTISKYVTNPQTLTQVGYPCLKNACSRVGVVKMSSSQANDDRKTDRRTERKKHDGKNENDDSFKDRDQKSTETGSKEYDENGWKVISKPEKPLKEKIKTN